MQRCREWLAKKRHLAVLLFAYTAVLLVVLSAFLRRSDAGNHLLRFWQTDGVIGPNAFGYDTSTANASLRMIPHHPRVAGSITVAIGGGITSKGIEGLSEENLVTTMSLFTVFIPSFCETASPGFDYRFYFAYDQTDPFFTRTDFLSAFKAKFLESVNERCAWSLNISIHTVRCSHSGKPTWAQNDAMMEAYLDNVEFYYRINDDTKMITRNWTEMFVEVLRSYVPVNVGVVGPKHYGGNIDILTYDFVHRTHVDVFGFYYPRLFTDWWGDDWITRVYEPYRSTKHQRVYLEHTMKGRRYNVSKEVGKKLREQVDNDKEILQRYIKYAQDKDSVKIDERKVIAMSLFGKEPRYLWGAIRNAQLAPILFPGWKLRIYVTSLSSRTSDAESWLVPKRILKKLKQLGAELVYVKSKSIPPVFWRYLVVDDSGIDLFIVRNADSHLSERDAVAVSDWLQHESPDKKTDVLHCIRDHPSHANLSIVDGLWGGRRAAIHDTLHKDIAVLLHEYLTAAANSSAAPSAFLRDVVWPSFSSTAYCHDSVSCGKWPGVRPFPSDRRSDEYLGRRFDEHQESIPAGAGDLALLHTSQICTAPASHLSRDTSLSFKST